MVTLIVVLIVVLLVAWAVQAYAPGDQPLKNLICLAVVLLAVLYILGAAGLIPLGNLR